MMPSIQEALRQVVLLSMYDDVQCLSLVCHSKNALKEYCIYTQKKKHLDFVPPIHYLPEGHINLSLNFFSGIICCSHTKTIMALLYKVCVFPVLCFYSYFSHYLECSPITCSVATFYMKPPLISLQLQVICPYEFHIFSVT